ncbi:MAG: EMC3/TMCO1 family protein [Promethearchaeota archaeon]
MTLAVFESSWDQFLSWIAGPPGSMVFVLLLALGISLLSAVLSRLLLDVEQMKRQQKLVQEHQEKKKELQKLETENPRKYRKEYVRWKRRDKSIQKIQQSMSLQRLKPTCIQFLPMIILFFIIRNFYGLNPIAAPPMNPVGEFPAFLLNMMMAHSDTVAMSDGWINFTAWYFLCSLSLNSIVQRTIGIRPQGGAFGGMGKMGGFSAEPSLKPPK